MHIVWTVPALRDLSAIRAHIELENPPAANRQVNLILAAVAGLTRFPESGRPGRHPGTRELVVGRTPYLAPYRIGGEVITVLRVLHGRQRWPAYL